MPEEATDLALQLIERLERHSSKLTDVVTSHSVSIGEIKAQLRLTAFIIAPIFSAVVSTIVAFIVKK